MSDAVQDEFLRAERFGDASQVGGTNIGPSSWLLELGAVARSFEVRAGFQQGRGHPIRAWSSRRAGARTRRELVRQALSAAASEPSRQSDLQVVIPLPEPATIVALPPWQTPEPERVIAPERHLAEEPATALLARIGAYTAAAGPSILSAR